MNFEEFGKKYDCEVNSSRDELQGHVIFCFKFANGFWYKHIVSLIDIINQLPGSQERLEIYLCGEAEEAYTKYVKESKQDIQVLTYGAIYKQFKEKTGIDGLLINDYRPCENIYGVPNVPNAIVIWLHTGERLIYIAEGVL